MAISTDRRMIFPPEVEVDFFGLQGSAARMQYAGWKFEEMVFNRTLSDPLGRERTIIMRHQTGLTARASCRDDDFRRMAYESFEYQNLRNRDQLLFVVQQVAAKPTEMHFRMPVQHVLRMQPMDMEPYPRELRAVSMRQFSLADLYPVETQEIIVEPKTVASLLEEIKKLQAPELAAIRERNRRRDPTRHLQDQPVPEWREEVSAQIITLRRAA